MIHQKYLFTLMQSLLYPAMLGTFFVLFFQYFIYGKNQIWTLQFSYYIFTVLYFIVSFLTNETLRESNSYNKITFSADFLELIVMFFLFSILTDKDEINLGKFYKTLSFLPICQIVWNFSVGEHRRKYMILNISFFLINICYYTGCSLMI